MIMIFILIIIMIIIMIINMLALGNTKSNCYCKTKSVSDLQLVS